MNEIHKSKLQILAEDSLMLESIQALAEEVIEESKPLPLEEDNNDLIGQKYRACIEAAQMIISILLKIETYKGKKVDSDNINRGK